MDHTQRCAVGAALVGCGRARNSTGITCSSSFRPIHNESSGWRTNLHMGTYRFLSLSIVMLNANKEKIRQEARNLGLKTETVRSDGKRVKVRYDVLQRQIAQKKRVRNTNTASDNTAMKRAKVNARKINASAKRTVVQRNNYKDENALNNAFFNADNVPFNMRNNAKNAINHKFKTALVNDIAPSPKLKRSAVALATTIKGYLTSGQFVKAVVTMANLFLVVSLYQYYPRMGNNILNEMSKTPFARAVSRSNNGSRSAFFARLLSAFGASPTKAQMIYESLMLTIPHNVHRRSLAGIMLNYLAMVVLALISMLPWEGASRQTSFRLLKFILQVIEQMFPKVAQLVFDVIVERKTTAKNRTTKIRNKLISVVLPLILKESLS